MRRTRATLRQLGWLYSVLAALLFLVIGVKPAAGQVLYGFGFLPGETEWSVFSINPSTGAFTPIVPVGPVAVSTETFDPVGKRLFFLSPPSTLYTVNLNSGAITTATVGNCCAFLFVGAGASATVPVLQPIATLVLIVLLGLAGWRLARLAP